MLVFIGVQLVTFGLLAEVMARTYYESQNKTTYVIREVRADARKLAHGRRADATGRAASASTIRASPSSSRSCSTRTESKVDKYRELVVGQPGLGALLDLRARDAARRSWVPGALGLFLRSKLYPLILGSVGRNVVFGVNVTLRHPHKIHIGDNVVIDDQCCLDAKGTDNRGIDDRQRRLHRPQHDPQLQERRHRHRRSRQHRVQLRDLLGLARARREETS